MVSNLFQVERLTSYSPPTPVPRFEDKSPLEEHLEMQERLRKKEGMEKAEKLSNINIHYQLPEWARYEYSYNEAIACYTPFATLIVERSPERVLAIFKRFSTTKEKEVEAVDEGKRWCEEQLRQWLLEVVDELKLEMRHVE